jgi:SOS-response transcriptional repressor LexA
MNLPQRRETGFEFPLTPAPPCGPGDTGAPEDVVDVDVPGAGPGFDLANIGDALHRRHYVHFCSRSQCTNAESAAAPFVQIQCMDELLEAAREFFRRGLKKTGISPTTITRPLNDPTWSKIPKLTTLAKLARVAQIELPATLARGGVVDLTPIARSIPVLGDIRAGSFERIAEEPKPVEWLPMEVPEYGGVDLFALRVVGRSMDRLYPDGSYVVCAPPAQSGLREGDVVAVRRWDRGLAETTLKQIERHKDGSYWLYPRSTDPDHQAPLALPVGDESAQSGLEIIGVVVSSYDSRRHGRGPLIIIR